MAKKSYQALRLAAIGPHFVATAVTGILLGKYVLDPWLGTWPVFTVSLVILGFVASFIHLLRELKALEDIDDPPSSQD